MTRVLVCFAFAVGLSACANQTGFSDGKASGASSAPNGGADGSVPGTSSGANHLGDGAVSSCSLQSLTVPVKILFVVDTSGSNARLTKNRGATVCDPAVDSCSPATDPFKQFRTTSIGNFFNLYKGKSNFSWNFTTFSNGGSRSLMMSGGAPVFSNGAVMQSAITSFASATDVGDTPYLAGLSTAYDAIAGDPDRTTTGSAAPLYYVIFLSDGYPTDLVSPFDGSIDQARLNSKISSLIALAPGQIKLSSVYYSTNYDSIAASTMSSMAGAGGGQFINANTSTTASINVNDLVVVPQRSCH